MEHKCLGHFGLRRVVDLDSLHAFAVLGLTAQLAPIAFGLYRAAILTQGTVRFAVFLVRGAAPVRLVFVFRVGAFTRAVNVVVRENLRRPVRTHRLVQTH